MGWKDTVSDKILHLDFLAPDVKLSIGGHGYYRTWLGVCLTLCYMPLLLIFMTSSIKSYLNRSSPVITQRSYNAENTIPVDVKNSKFMPIMYVGDYNNIPISIDNATKIGSFRSFVASVEEDIANITYEEMSVVPCRELIDNGTFSTVYSYNYSEKYMQKVRDSGMCISPGDRNIILSGNLNDPHSEWLEFEVYPCSTTVGTCATVGDLRGYTVVMESPYPVFNLSNYENPVHDTIKMILSTNIDTRSSKVTLKDFSTQVITDTRGMFLSDIIRANFTMMTVSNVFTSALMNRPETLVECTDQQISDYINCLPYLTVQVVSTSAITETIRSYKGTLETIGEIGGSKQLLDMFFISIYTFVHGFFMKRFLFNKLFGQIISQEKAVASNQVVNVMAPPEFSERQVHRQEDCRVDQMNHPPSTHPNSPPGRLAEIRALIRRPCLDNCMSPPLHNGEKVSKSRCPQEFPIHQSPFVFDGDIVNPSHFSLLRSAGKKVIEDSIDLVTIVSEINNMKVIVNALLGDVAYDSTTKVHALAAARLEIECATNGHPPITDDAELEHCRKIEHLDMPDSHIGGQLPEIALHSRRDSHKFRITEGPPGMRSSGFSRLKTRQQNSKLPIREARGSTKTSFGALHKNPDDKLSGVGRSVRFVLMQSKEKTASNSLEQRALKFDQ